MRESVGGPDEHVLALAVASILLDERERHAGCLFRPRGRDLPGDVGLERFHVRIGLEVGDVEHHRLSKPDRLGAGRLGQRK